MKSREDALSLLCEYTTNDSLRKHGLAVEAAMRWYAGRRGQDEAGIELWGITGLLHDFDYERFPEIGPEGHPWKGSEILSREGYPEDMRTAILGHGGGTGVPRESDMAKTLFAVDELCGFLVACTLVRPDRSLNGLEVKSVKKKLKDKAFAKGCNRQDILQGADEIGLPLDEHIANTIQALRGAAAALDLA